MAFFLLSNILIIWFNIMVEKKEYHVQIRQKWNIDFTLTLNIFSKMLVV